MKTFIRLFKTNLKIFGRSKKNIFWVFILPLTLIFLSGLILKGTVQEFSLVYIFPGILAAALMYLSEEGAVKFLSLREKNIMKRLSIIPFSRKQILSSEILVRIFIGLVQAGLILLLGDIIFKINLKGNLILIFLIIFLGLLTFLSMGYMFIGLVKNIERGKSLFHLVQIIMILCSGIFFPVEMMPGFIQPAAQIMPLTYLVDSLREVIAGIPGYFPLNVNIYILTLFLILTFILNIKFWSWE